MFRKAGAVLILIGLIAVSLWASNLAVGVLDQYLPHDWQDRLFNGLMVMAIFYLLAKVETLERQVKSISYNLDRFRDRGR